ncbi:elongation factor P maturation arginine rhamnosyltransferase EarP, partial [Aeromonas veronii]
FVRAQWAARPFLWHIYPQEEEYHLVKLEAFLDRYLASHPQSRATWIRGLMLALNRGEPCQALWQGWDAQCNGWQEEASLWPDRLLAGGDLVT